MLLAIDVGNTNIVVGVFADATLLINWRLATDPKRMPDEYAVLLESLFRLSDLDIRDIDGAVICSVVPVLQSTITQAVSRYCKIAPLNVSAALDLGMEIRYQPRTAVGADRVANAVAAIHTYGTPAVVVDFGTGTNFDAISRDGAYVGGAIAPGLEISMDALVSRAAQLPSFTLAAPPTAVGTSTAASLQSGLIYGYAGLVDGLVERICEELGTGAHVIATGGLAGIIAPHARTVQEININLTLLGLYLIHVRHTNYSSGARQAQSVSGGAR